MNILNISAHFGGGVGTALNTIQQFDISNNYRFAYLNPGNEGELFKVDMIKEADVVILHFWNHPSTFEFLCNIKLPPCRLIMWSHVSGLYAPYVFFNKVLDYGEKFIFTTPISYKSIEVKKFINKSKLGNIWSTASMDKFHNIVKTKHDTFNIGMVGTADYGKLRSDFVDLCAKIKIEKCKFVVCTSDSQQTLINRAEELDISDKFSFKGKITDIKSELSDLDILGYPLHNKHFGSCEQVLGEAMSCGVVPVVFNNPAETYIITHLENGMIVNTEMEYIEAVQYLYENKNELMRMSDNAKKRAKELYNIQKTVSQWNSIFKEVYEKHIKTEKNWSVQNLSPHEVYITSLGKYGKCFLDYVFADLIGNDIMLKKCEQKILNIYKANSMFLSTSKGSIHQYVKYYSGNKYLNLWQQLANKLI